MSRLYDPADEADPIWPVFGVWLDKFNVRTTKVVTIRAIHFPLESLHFN